MTRCLPPSFFVTPHAVAQYRARVDPAAAPAEAIVRIQQALQAPRFVRPDPKGRGQLYGVTLNGRDYNVPVTPPPADRPDGWPVVPSILEWWALHELKADWRQRFRARRRDAYRARCAAYQAALPTPAAPATPECSAVVAVPGEPIEDDGDEHDEHDDHDDGDEHDGALEPDSPVELVMLPQLAPYFARYQAINAPDGGVPLRVVCHLRVGARIAGYDPINLDNLLAGVIWREAMGTSLAPDQAAVYAQTVPLRCLWVSPDRLPLWAATPLLPSGDSAPDVTYWHKRAQPGDWTGTPKGVFAIRPTDGRWMERRVPLPTTVCRRLEATAIGHPQEVLRLLQQVSWVGKKRRAGMGEVADWAVLPLPPGDAFHLLDHAGRLTRTLPADALLHALVPPAQRDALGVSVAPEVSALAAQLGGRFPAEPLAPLGWTPPQWKAALWRPGWPVGTPLAPDTLRESATVHRMSGTA